MTRRPKPNRDPETSGAFLPNGARAKAALNRAIMSSCWGGLERRLTHKTTRTPADNQSELVKVNPRNTSRTCAECGQTAGENRESQAVFTCGACGHQAHADTNAAINILRRAIMAAIPETAESQPRGMRMDSREWTHQPSSGNTAGTVNRLAASTAGNPRP